MNKEKGQTFRFVVNVFFIVFLLMYLAFMSFMLGKSCVSSAEPRTSTSRDAIAAAQANGQEADSIEARGLELGLNCIGNTEECAEMIARAERNPALKLAFLKAKTAGVSIMLGDSLRFGDSAGEVGNGYVVINIDKSDEDIIAFLTD